MKKILLADKAWLDKVKVTLTKNCRFKAEAPGGLVGFGRNREDAIRHCAASATKDYSYHLSKTNVFEDIKSSIKDN